LSYDPSRKQFFGKLLGLCAAVGSAPKLLAKTPATPKATSPATAEVSSLIRAESRAVPRRDDSL
jgi:hypothetical protein